jgi:alpha-beta hydrolase superfamily lysophospholipase
MKKIFLFILLLFSLNSISQQIEGNWYGVLDVMGKEISFGLEFKGESGRLFNPEKAVQSYNIDSMIVEGPNLLFFINSMRLKYSGKVENDSIKGFWMQAGQSFPLLFTRKEVKAKEQKRPQTPVPPFNYYTEELLVVNNSANLSLSGILTLPTNEGKKYPVVVLISGSGPQNRDSEILGHKSFAVIADHLAKQGVGSFRYDERGVGKSTGKYQGSDLNDFQSDVDAIVNQLLDRKEIGKLGLLGHSEGGIIAPKYASENKKKIDFVIMLGAPGVPVTELMHKQRRTQYEISGMTEKAMEANKQMFAKIDEVVLASSYEGEKNKLVSELVAEKMKKDDASDQDIKTTTDAILKFIEGPWYKSFISINPADYLKKMRCPVLAIGGGKDVQVDAKDNLAAISKILNTIRFRKVPNTISTYGNLNHLFQPAVTGNIDEYGKIETTIDRAVLFSISEWINELK